MKYTVPPWQNSDYVRYTAYVALDTCAECNAPPGEPCANKNKIPYYVPSLSTSAGGTYVRQTPHKTREKKSSDQR